MVVLIAYFSVLETVKSEEEAFISLQNKKIYEEKTLKALAKVINDKKMFDFLNAEH